MSEKNEEKKKFSLKSLFINEETENVNVKSTEKPVENVTVTQSPMSVTPAVGVVNKDTYTTLMKVLEERNLPGPDYLELKKAADAMANVITDENVRYISAYSVLKSTNPKLNKTMVISSIDEYVKYIESERSEAKNQLTELYNQEVGNRQKEIQNRAELIEQNKKKIEDLNSEILKASQEINSINGEMLSKQTELDIQEKNFNATVDAVISGLNNDKTKLNLIIAE